MKSSENAPRCEHASTPKLPPWPLTLEITARSCLSFPIKGGVMSSPFSPVQWQRDLPSDRSGYGYARYDIVPLGSMVSRTTRTDF